MGSRTYRLNFDQSLTFKNFCSTMIDGFTDDTSKTNLAPAPIKPTAISNSGGTMPSILNPYISFKDNARQALEFYENVFGGKLVMNTFKEFGASHGPSSDNLIMHGQ